jgi:hypothetical protein
MVEHVSLAFGIAGFCTGRSACLVVAALKAFSAMLRASVAGRLGRSGFMRAL